MPVKIDLHIHSTLSACCDKENTVNNIVNMSKIMNTQIIALADHNSAGNVRAAKAVAERNGILLVPAMEVTAAEEIHVLCLFKSVSDAEQFSDEIYKSLPKYELNEKLYNPQILLNENDREVGRVKYLLSVATKYGLYELIEKIKNLGGVPVPAHVDRESESLISVLGYVPDDLGVSTLEVSGACPNELADKLKDKYQLITGSDAHSLERICLGGCSLELPEVSIEALFKKLTRGTRTNKNAKTNK